MRLTPHFTLEEMIKSKQHPETKNEPNEQQILNLINVCEWLEILRATYNDCYSDLHDGQAQPIIINSGFRCKMLNHAVGGEPTSNHLDGCAADIKCRDCAQAVRYAAILIDTFTFRHKQWDEIIIEKKGARFWLHFAVRPERNRCKVTCITL